MAFSIDPNVMAAIVNPRDNMRGGMAAILSAANQGHANRRQDDMIADRREREDELGKEADELKRIGAKATSIRNLPDLQSKRRAIITMKTQSNDPDEIVALDEMLAMDEASLNRDLDEDIAFATGRLMGGMQSAEKFGAVQRGFDSDGNPLFAQVGTRGTLKPVSGFAPESPEQKIDLAARKASAVAEGKAEVKEKTEPRLQAKIAKAKAVAAKGADSESQLSAMEANLPTLNQTVSALKELGKIATYTTAGKVYDTAVRELGLSVPKGATARAKYIATVSNEVLPLLKATFGAAFTKAESDKLEATLGDPDMSPDEKDAQLDAFVESKMRQVESLRSAGGRMQSPATTPVATDEELLNKYGI